MACVLFLIDTIYCNIFRYYLRKKQLFLDFFSPFGNLDSILKIFKKTMTLIGDVLLNLRIPKNMVR